MGIEDNERSRRDALTQLLILAELVRKGKIEGRVEGEAFALIRLVEKRFGALPAELRARIMAADPGTLESWFDRAIDASSRDAVFAESPLEPKIN